MIRILPIALVLLFAAYGLAEEKQCTLTITEAAVAGRPDRVLTFVDIDNSKTQARVAQRLSVAMGEAVYAQRTSSPDNRFPGPIILTGGKRKMAHEDALKDMGIGAGLCLGGCLFVMIAGDEPDPYAPPPEGFYATVGNKKVVGPMACMTGIAWVAGAIMIGKGVIELFLPSAPAEYNAPAKNTEEIISGEKLALLSKTSLSFSAEDEEAIAHRVIQCVMSR